MIGIVQWLTDRRPLTLFDYRFDFAHAWSNPELHEKVHGVHEAFSDMLIVAIALHVCAAMYHQVVGVPLEVSEFD